MEKLKPSTALKTQFAKVAVEAFPNFASVDENCPFVRFFALFLFLFHMTCTHFFRDV